MSELAQKLERLAENIDVAASGLSPGSRMALVAAFESAAARIKELEEALRIFVACAYPVSKEINPRGHNWSEAYLDAALRDARAVLKKQP